MIRIIQNINKILKTDASKEKCFASISEMECMKKECMKKVGGGDKDKDKDKEPESSSSS